MSRLAKAYLMGVVFSVTAMVISILVGNYEAVAYIGVGALCSALGFIIS